MRTRHKQIKSLSSKIRYFFTRWQRIFYAPKQLSAVNICDEFADVKVEYIFNYTNNLIKLTKNGQSYYFKEARERCEFKKYIYDSVHWFFTEVCVEPLLEAEILQSLNKRGNFKKLVNMGNKVEDGSPFNEYLMSNDERILGLPAVHEEKKGIIRKFVFFIYGEINNYFYNFGVKNGQRQVFLAVRALAVKKLADTLSVGYMIPKTVYVKLYINGQEKYGTLENVAAGMDVTPVPCNERQKFVTPQLLRELTSLNILDVLCYDNDHRVNNYYTITDDKGRYVGVTSFDNDAPDVFFPSSSVNVKHSTNCSRLIDRRRLINRPHMDRMLAESVLGLKRKSLTVLCDYLNALQRCFLWKRIRKLQRAILKTCTENPDFLLEKDEWTTVHIKEDVSGKYGKTYLVSFLTDCHYPDGMHPFDVC